MKVSILGTGSKGNCYCLNINNRNIILDCGLPYKEITTNKLFPSFKTIDFLFTSHIHGDHNKSLKDFKNTGIEILSYETLKPKVEKWSFNNFELTTFPISHNVPNWGVIIKENVSRETLCYMTDFNKAPKVEGCNTYIYEINYIESRIDEMIDNDIELQHNGFVNHQSLEEAVEYFNSLKTRPKNLVICHLSSSHAIEKQILNTMKSFADNVVIAHKGDSYEWK